LRERLGLLALFVAQFVLGAVFTNDVELLVVSVVYLVLAVAMLIRNRAVIVPVLRDGFRTPYAVLTGSDKAAKP